jgi:hypothetical protein
MKIRSREPSSKELADDVVAFSNIMGEKFGVTYLTGLLFFDPAENQIIGGNDYSKEQPVPYLEFIGTVKRVGRLQSYLRTMEKSYGFNPPHCFEAMEERIQEEIKSGAERIAVPIDLSPFLDKPEKFHDPVQTEYKRMGLKWMTATAAMAVTGLAGGADGVRRVNKEFQKKEPSAVNLTVGGAEVLASAGAVSLGTAAAVGMPAEYNDPEKRAEMIDSSSSHHIAFRERARQQLSEMRNAQVGFGLN